MDDNTKTVSFRIPRELHKAIKMNAIDKEKTIGQYLLGLAEEDLEEKGYNVRRPFIMVDWDFIISDLFDWNEKRLFIILKMLADDSLQCSPSVKKLCKLSQLSKMTVLKSLNGLKEKQAIQIEHRKNNDNKSNQSNLYILCDDPRLWKTENRKG